MADHNNGQHAPPDLAGVWQRIKQAADRCDDPLRLMAVTTVDDDNRPAGRLMVVRGASTRMARLWFYSTKTSAKVEHIAARPDVCIVGFDPENMAQLVIRGRAQVHSDGQLADDHWSQFQTTARVMSDQPADSKCRQTDGDPRMAAMMQALANDDEAMQRDAFALIDVHVDSIEWTAAEDAELRRAVFTLSTAE